MASSLVPFRQSLSESVSQEFLVAALHAALTAVFQHGKRSCPLISFRRARNTGHGDLQVAVVVCLSLSRPTTGNVYLREGSV